MLATVFTVLRQAVRRLCAAPGYMFTVLAVLALGIGATTAVFSVVYGVLLKPYGFERRGQLISFRESIPELSATRWPVNYRHFLYLQQNAHAVESAAVLSPASYSVGATGAPPSVVPGLSVSSDFFRTLGISPAQGRDFRPDEFAPGRDAVAVITRAAWLRFFPGQRFTQGRTLRMDGQPVTIAGILPASFQFPAIAVAPDTKLSQAQPYGIFRPHVPNESDRGSLEGDYSYVAVARLRPDISLQTAQAQMNGLIRAFTVQNRLEMQPDVVVRPFSEEVTGAVSRSLTLLLLAISSVLLIGCVNLANLQLSRSVTLMPEHALRSALGASRKRVALESLTENLLLAAGGILLALPLAEGGLHFFLRAAPSSLPRLGEVGLNAPVFCAALGLSLFTSLICGLLPAWRAGSAEPAKAMQSGNRGGGETRAARRLRAGLLTVEIACSTVLLAVTLLLSQSFARLLASARPLGGEPVTLAQAYPYTPQYQDADRSAAKPPEKPTQARAAFIEKALSALAMLPGVNSVSVTNALPLTGPNHVDFLNRPDKPLPPARQPLVNTRRISPGYFATLGLPILSGRGFTQADRGNDHIAIISASAAHAVWQGEDPVGRTFDHNGTPTTVIGVAADTRFVDPRADTPALYLPFWSYPPFEPVFLIRGQSPSASEIKQAVWSVDPQVAVPMVLPLAAQTAESVAVERFQALLVGAFGAAGLLLAMLGVYGAVSYSVNRRMREWGLRMALGSGRGQLQRTVLREAARPLPAALLLGVLGSLAAERWIHSLLYGGGWHGWAALAPALAALPVAVLLAAWPAARRAAHADPAAVLRIE